MRDGVVVVGDGPAGSALAAACAEVGLPVTLVAPDPSAGWPATYGAWVDDLAGLPGLHADDIADAAPGAGVCRQPAALWQAVFSDPIVAFDGSEPYGIARAYGLLDNTVLRTRLRARLRAAGGRVVAARVRAAAHDARGTVLTLDEGEELRAGLVVDATGHRPVLAERAAPRALAWQVAHGIVATISDAPVPEGGMAFMDWRTPVGAAADPATFLYAMDLGGGRIFVEETSLAARPPLALPVLEAKLRRRLAAAGATVGGVEAQEAVAFPMGVGVPPRPQRIVAYGAAAGMVHPATGYQVGSALRRAPAVAEAIAEAVARDRHTDALAAAAWQAVWPADLLRQRELHAYGLQVLLGLDSRDTQRFFRAFFSLPPEDWRAYVSGAASSRDLARIMLAVARRLPPSLQWRVTSGAFGSDGLALARAVLAGRS